jgi:CheY-like chemotaxis protein
VTSSLFEHLGYETIYRDSAEAALKLLEAGTKIDFVFSDIVMPGTIDGVGLAGEIQSRYPNLRSPYDRLQRCCKGSSAKPENITQAVRYRGAERVYRRCYAPDIIEIIPRASRA